jgi:sporulation protein YlmC with PRC-barrel domain
MLGQDQIDSLMGRDIYGADGGKIGTAVQVYADDETGKPEWVSVRTGLFGTKQSFVPLADASVSGDQITVPYDKAFVKDAPNIDEEGHLSRDQERELYAYYNRTTTTPRQRREPRPADWGVTVTPGRATTTGATRPGRRLMMR